MTITYNSTLSLHHSLTKTRRTHRFLQHPQISPNPTLITQTPNPKTKIHHLSTHTHTTFRSFTVCNLRNDPSQSPNPMTSSIDSHTHIFEPWMIVTVSRVVLTQWSKGGPNRIKWADQIKWGKPCNDRSRLSCICSKVSDDATSIPEGFGRWRSMFLSLNKSVCVLFRRDSDLLGRLERGEPLDPSSRHTWTGRSEPPLSKRCWHSCCEGRGGLGGGLTYYW